MHSNKIEAHKKELKLTDRQKDILIGKVLGDGHLETKDGGRTYRLKIEHSLKQKEYVNWLYEEFKDWVLTPPQVRTRFVVLRTVAGEYDKYWFNTLSSGSFRFYAHQFYKDKKKIAPRLIKKMLTPLALAVWFMDDGSIKSAAHKTVFLNTHSFDAGSIKLLQKALMEKFGIKTAVRKEKYGRQIYFLSETIDKFAEIVMPHILPSMRYKIPKGLVTKLPKK